MDSRLLTGTVDMIILHVVLPAPTYGYEITQAVLRRSGGSLELKEGSLYPALHRLERAGLLESYWEEPEAGRRRKFYRITAEGSRALESKRKEWEHFAVGVNGVLGVEFGVA
ncbi:MAG: PadR family transcriptional regulator [Candidatus Hydrogenedentes bacterium]|nr:PadR family transcriptional regulator [Candidatus Hydrogenedentota bacterium]